MKKIKFLLASEVIFEVDITDDDYRRLILDIDNRYDHIHVKSAVTGVVSYITRSHIQMFSVLEEEQKDV